jgi:serine/threonine-protein kinase
LDASVAPSVEVALQRALSVTREPRFSSAEAFAKAITDRAAEAPAIAAFVSGRAKELVEERGRYVAQLERGEPAPDSAPADPELVTAAPVSFSTSGTVDLPEVSVFGRSERPEFHVERTEILPSSGSPVTAPPRPSARRRAYLALLAIPALAAVLYMVPWSPAAPLSLDAARTRDEGLRPLSSRAPALPTAAPSAASAAALEAPPTARAQPALAPSSTAASNAAPGRPRASAKPTAAPGPNCQPPYTTDARGVKHFKEECM